ncbi:MAG: mismatch repair protein MutL, partial [Acidobacteriota bacterium]|nr:mismatch repair protein MutL [Acidobacteriota bacterium]
MSKVKALKEDVYKKIAAGEVVERPLSVVKELVENSIDAGADSIKIEIAEGGKRLIKVVDNGSGFDAEDIEPAFKNHSTSKLSELSDFDNLLTLGFRGEALPSILEVSKIEVETSSNSDGSGIRCVFEGGQLALREAIACSRGTTMVVKDLFFNFPVRRKFLKAERTELGQVLSFLEPVVLVNFNISFEVAHNGKTVFLYKKAESLKERVYQVFGKDFLDSLQEVDIGLEQYRLKGFISKINTGESVKKHQYFFVNGRSIREKTLIAAFNNTFTGFLEKNRYPVGIILLTIPPREVDVNIHPMKLEIKFEDAKAVYRFIKYAIERTFSS